ncbi:hypothetical protein K469DRAFT_503087, partial [Zopfia rhizophila CBS 207.26]
MPSSISATYSSPASTSPNTFNHHLPAIPSNPSTDERTDYLGKLQSAVKQLQGDINEFLTKKKMEEDKAAGGAKSVDDAKEEENYGEEAVE